LLSTSSPLTEMVNITTVSVRRAARMTVMAPWRSAMFSLWRKTLPRTVTPSWRCPAGVTACFSQT